MGPCAPDRGSGPRLGPDHLGPQEPPRNPPPPHSVAPYIFRRAKRQAEHKGIHLKGVEATRLRSDLEEDFLALLLGHRFPHPEINVEIGRHEVDFLWREHKLVVEVDSFLYHRGSIAFQADHARDLDLRSRSYTVLRFTEAQIENEPSRVAADVAAALRR